MLDSPQLALLELLAVRPGERVLDAGCGLGAASAEMEAAGAAVTGIDIHAPLLEQARITCRQADFVAADLLTWRPDEPFDAIYAFATLHWVQPPKKAAKALARLLTPGDAWLRRSVDSPGRLANSEDAINPNRKTMNAC
jgi:trans-aconitate methyltransferase